jgi:hypothetical protein
MRFPLATLNRIVFGHFDRNDKKGFIWQLKTSDCKYEKSKSTHSILNAR